MPDYGKAAYWNDRYLMDGASDPFDWLFTYEDVAVVLEDLLPDRDLPILMVGAGNAPFSIDMSQIGGYKQIVNTDLSDVVIDQQKKMYPEQQWLVMDVRKMTFDSNIFPVVVDKSLIDTLMCYSDSKKCLGEMIDEIYRVLKPGGRYITFSLHPQDEVVGWFSPDNYDWVVSAFDIASKRWNVDENRRRAVAHTMIVCDKLDFEGKFPMERYPLKVRGTLTPEEYSKLNKLSEAINFKAAMKLSTTDDLMYCLGNVVDSMILKAQHTRRPY
jgi:SAM-dependent methyltransferase